MIASASVAERAPATIPPPSARSVRSRDQRAQRVTRANPFQDAARLRRPVRSSGGSARPAARLLRPPVLEVFAEGHVRAGARRDAGPSAPADRFRSPCRVSLRRTGSSEAQSFSRRERRPDPSRSGVLTSPRHKYLGRCGLATSNIVVDVGLHLDERLLNRGAWHGFSSPCHRMRIRLLY